MSKTRKHERRIFNDYEESYEDNKYNGNNVNKRTQRRIDRAIRTKDIDTLIESEEDY